MIIIIIIIIIIVIINVIIIIVIIIIIIIIIMIIMMMMKGGNVLFNDTLNTFYLWLFEVRYMVKDHSDSERGNLLLTLHGLLFPISSKGSFICTIPQTG